MAIILCLIEDMKHILCLIEDFYLFKQNQQLMINISLYEIKLSEFEI